MILMISARILVFYVRKVAHNYWFHAVFVAAVLISLRGARADCGGEEGGGGTVVEILNAETLLLDDARAVRLIGALPPRFATGFASHGGTALDPRPELRAVAARLALGKRVRLIFGGTRTDRYGRLLAQVHVETEGQPVWLQGALVEEGLALAYSFSDNRACQRELLKREAAARALPAGYWRTGLFRLRAAADTRLLLGLTNTYQIVEGRVTSAVDMGGRVYLNFGPNYRDDFTVSIDKRDRGVFVGAEGGLAAIAGRGKDGPALDALKGRRLRARGWIESFNGPMISVTHPEQIEVEDVTGK
jgi:micrococcal nuclease